MSIRYLLGNSMTQVYHTSTNNSTKSPDLIALRCYLRYFFNHPTKNKSEHLPDYNIRVGFASVPAGGGGSPPHVTNTITLSGKQLCIRLNRDRLLLDDIQWANMREYLADLT